MACADLNGHLLGAFHTPARLGGSAAGEKALAQKIVDNTKLTHEKQIIKNFRNVIASSFPLGTRGFSPGKYVSQYEDIQGEREDQKC